MQHDKVAKWAAHRPGVRFTVSLIVGAAAWTPFALADLRASVPDARDGSVVKKVLKFDQSGENLLQPGAWRPYEKGFVREGDLFLCDNGADTRVQRGVSQTVVLNQTTPEPILAVAWSRAEGVGGARDSDYSLYLDLQYTDGTPLWGQVDSWTVGTHDWQKAQVLVFPEKPVASVSFYMLLRGHAGKAWFRGAELKVVRVFLFDGVPIEPTVEAAEGFQVRDVAAETDFVSIERSALDLKLDCRSQEDAGATFFDVTLQDTSGEDRAVTLVYSVPLPAAECRWLRDPRHSVSVAEGREYLDATRYAAGTNGRMSRYPLGAVAGAEGGMALGIDMAHPAFFRVGFNAGTHELFLAYDIGLAAEKPVAHLRFCKFRFDATWGFRGALARFYELFPEQFACRIPTQGLWMPFAKISDVNGWRDFGFRFKEGDNETAWDDRHEILTFRYTEPMTWWMSMKEGMARNLDEALAEAKRLADERKDPHAQALFTSGFHDETGQFAARLLDTPWCNGAVWSMNSMPAVMGDATDFKNKWNPRLREELYGPGRSSNLDGEYIDSSEGYVTNELDFRREHFLAAQTPLVFSLDERKPAVFRGLIAFEYVRAIARDVHGMGRYMMANATPGGLCWLAPMLDVLGTETDWNPGGSWRPMSDSELLYRRALCKGKPYCFLMNSEFERFSYNHVERYMKRCLAYGMFPGFFSHNASQGHYFSRPELYERDRPLFKKYVPLCKVVAEAGWEPVTLARSDCDGVYVERYGDRYLTVFNDTDRRQAVSVTVEMKADDAVTDLVGGREIDRTNGRIALTLDPEDVAVLQMLRD
ncbi:MAG: hypothetical protein KBE65_16795 [Phycisphaerae bacterium]|nr:hypothetical protein [Phycisphaerae bacterium]